LQWSRWFRCESSHSLLVVPSKPGIFAVAEEIMSVPEALSPSKAREGHDFSRAVTALGKTSASAAEGIQGGGDIRRSDPSSNVSAAPAAEFKRMLAVLQFSEDDDMAFVLDRMFTRINPMRSRLASGQCFLRFVVIEDQEQRRNICTALNQWLQASAEKASGIPSAFSSSLELPRVAVELPRVAAGDSSAPFANAPVPPGAIAHLDSGAHKNLHCSQPLPSGF
jgi:hypothetical protein